VQRSVVETPRVGLDSVRPSRAGAQVARTATQGFKTYSAQATELATRIRESIFKKIAFEMLPDGGRMSVRLDPPELGQLDIHMVVEKGSVVKLSIGAERSEVAQMLDRHMPDLKEHLNSQGIDVQNAEVFTHDFRGETFAEGKSEPGSSSEDMGEPETQETRGMPGTGYITAEGLDFWV
jgi:flagellar hook-length control protein FliK